MIQPGDLNTRITISQFENFTDGYGGFREDSAGQNAFSVWCKWIPTSGEMKEVDGKMTEFKEATIICRKKSIQGQDKWVLADHIITKNDGPFIPIPGGGGAITDVPYRYKILDIYDSKYKYYVEIKVISVLNEFLLT